MALETATYLGSLITTWPLGSDQRSTADDHFRLLKGVLARTFPNVNAEVSISAGEANFLRSVSWAVQDQFNAMKTGSLGGSTISGTVHYAMSAGNAAMLGDITACRYARYDLTASFAAPVIINAGFAVAGKDLGTISGTLNIEPSSANYFGAVLAGNISSISIGAALTFGHVVSIRLQQDGVGANAVANWPASVVWADGSLFEASSTISAIDFVTMVWDAPLGVWLASPRKYG